MSGPRWLAVTAVSLAIVVLLWVLFVAKSHELRVEGYRVVDQHTVIVEVSGPSRAWTRLASVTETPSDVTIRVETLDLLPGPGTAEAVRVELSVSLEQPLGDRVIKDWEGNPVPQPVCVNDTCTREAER